MPWIHVDTSCSSVPGLFRAPGTELLQGDRVKYTIQTVEASKIYISPKHAVSKPGRKVSMKIARPQKLACSWNSNFVLGFLSASDRMPAKAWFRNYGTPLWTKPAGKATGSTSLGKDSGKSGNWPVIQNLCPRRAQHQKLQFKSYS